MGDGYNPFLKTALKRDKLSNPAKMLKSYKLLDGKILDFGTGRGTDVRILKEEGYDIDGYDKFNEQFNDCSLLDKKYDTVMSNYVFNVIPSLEEHSEVLEILKGISNNIFISVRADKRAVKDSWEYSEESLGYWTSTGSFQRFYNEELINELFGNVDFIINNNSYKLFKINKLND